MTIDNVPEFIYPNILQQALNLLLNKYTEQIKVLIATRLIT
ncbi:Type III restriction-modification system methylation subunit [Methanosarcina mazei Tuc01]|uniref:Type III restriction-modification system methylation subunit n=1 Tax=Methanosarcina mazei Tuc01 TaxID=1236903 RepID=M1QF83_METMZ|nr:Type III restriction-modification system methylation subunit [Methanosarcina mazei Tuc01]